MLEEKLEMQLQHSIYFNTQMVTSSAIQDHANTFTNSYSFFLKNFSSRSFKNNNWSLGQPRTKTRGTPKEKALLLFTSFMTLSK